MKSLNYILQSYKSSLGIVSGDYDRQYLQWIIEGMNVCRTKFKMIDTAVKSVELAVIPGVSYFIAIRLCSFFDDRFLL